MSAVAAPPEPPGGLRAALGPAAALLRTRSDVVALVAIVGSTLLFPRTVPGGIYALGVVNGSLLALNAVGLVLVYRSNRVVNFAQVAVGAVGATFFAAMVTFEPVLRWAVEAGLVQTRPSWFGQVNYWGSAVLGLGISVALGWALHRFVIRRFDDAPRLVATVATLFVVSLLALLTRELSRASFWRSREQRDAQLAIGRPDPPFELSWKLPSYTFAAQDLLIVAALAVLLPALVLYLRRSAAGVAIRAAADNPRRVQTLGVDVDAVVGRVWLLAGLLSGFAAVLTTMGSGPPDTESGLDVGLLIRILAAAVIGRLVSLPVAAAAAVGIGVLHEATLYAFGTTLALDGMFVVVIGVVLALQRRQSDRADVDSASSWRSAREARPIPRELRSLPEVVKWLRAGAALLAVVLLGAPWVLSPSQTDLAAYVLIATMMFLSLLVLTGWAGQISLGQFAFAAVGAWVTAASGWPFVLAVLAGAVAGGVTALAVGAPALRLRGLHLAIMTLAASLSVSTLLLNPRYLGKHLPDTITRPVVLGMDLDDGRVFYYVLLVLLALVTAAVAGLRHSGVARALLAARDNEPAAQAFGVNLLRTRLAAFAVSGAIAGFAGSLLAYQQHAVLPDTFSAYQSLQIFLYAVIGGLGAVSAPLVAGGYFAVVTVLGLPLRWVQLLTGAGGIVLLLFATGGLAQVCYDIRDGLLRGVARRRKIVVPSLLADVRELSAADTRLPILPKRRARGGTAFVPARYRLDGQYGIPAPVDDG